MSTLLALHVNGLSRRFIILICQPVCHRDSRCDSRRCSRCGSRHDSHRDSRRDSRRANHRDSRRGSRYDSRRGSRQWWVFMLAVWRRHWCRLRRLWSGHSFVFVSVVCLESCGPLVESRHVGGLFGVVTVAC